MRGNTQKIKQQLSEYDNMIMLLIVLIKDYSVFTDYNSAIISATRTTLNSRSPISISLPAEM